ncbi:UNVERIFIED_CONTAM: Retrovirus-related Pol polyprotein from transposon RE1 [Sesamum indicum]
MVETQFGVKIKVLRSDNGSEFVNLNCQNLHQRLGIIHQTSCIYTPKQNGRAESKHRHLLNVARALLFKASLPLKFWGNYILAATYIINRTPTDILGWSTPYQALNRHPPTYTHLKTFGCLCFATNLNPHKSKFHKRAHKCFFLGYSMTQKGYKAKTECFECPLPTPPVDTDDNNTKSLTVPSPSHVASPENAPIVQQNDVVTSSQQSTRRSTRVSQKPLWLNNFVCQQNSSTLHCNSPTYSSFVASISAVKEPRSFAEAVQSPEWRAAMDTEIRALETNHTWKLTPLPAGKRAIGCKWVFKVKLRTDGSVERYKARLVAKGYNQIEGIDYTESFSPVAKTVTVRLVLTLAAANGWVLHQLDVNNAFLHGYLDEDIYMIPPVGYQVASGLVCKLERSLYDLKQASCQWNMELTLKLQEFGFTQCAHDHCLFLLHTAHGLVSLLVYIDDILLAGACVDELHKFLGLEIARNVDGIYLAQTKYVLDIIADTGLPHAKAALRLFLWGLTPDSYRRLVGRLLYLGFTRPDISYSVQQLSQYLNRPCDTHWKAALHVVKYLKGYPTLGLFLPAANTLNLRGYCDADWASCCDSRRSLTGFCVFLAEAEYHNLASTKCELQWLLCVQRCFAAPVLIRNFAQIVDIFTKALPLQLFSSFLSKLGLVSFAPSPTYGGLFEYLLVTLDGAILQPYSSINALKTPGAEDDLLNQG